MTIKDTKFNQWNMSKYSLLSLLRLVIPFSCFLEAISSPKYYQGFGAIGVISLIDILFQIYKGSSDLHLGKVSRAVFIRDCLYASFIYFLYISNPHAMALSLIPVPILESVLIASNRSLAIKVLGFIAGLVLLRRLELIHLGLGSYYLTRPIYLSVVVLVCLFISWLLEQRDYSQNYSIKLKQQIHKVMTIVIEQILTNNNVVIRSPERAYIEELISKSCTPNSSSLNCEKLAQEVADKIQNHIRNLNLLTPREREILQLMAEFHSYREISQLLHVSEGTVRAHAANIMQKAQVHTRQDAVAWGQNFHIISVKEDPDIVPLAFQPNEISHKVEI